jgi:hypothetical protein
MALSDLSKFGKKLADLAQPENFVQEVMIDWANDITVKLKENLLTTDSYATGNLYQSIEPLPPTVNDDGNLELDILMADYWDYQNQGVNGIGKSTFQTEYLFRAVAKVPTPSGEPTFLDSLLQWIAFKGIAEVTYTDENGERQALQMSDPKSRKQGAFILMGAIKRKGITPTNFVNNALTPESLNDLENSIFEAIKKDLLT